MAAEIKLRSLDLSSRITQEEFIVACQQVARKMEKDINHGPIGLEFNIYTRNEALKWEFTHKFLDVLMEQMRLFVALRDTTSLVVDQIVVKVHNKMPEHKIIIRKI